MSQTVTTVNPDKDSPDVDGAWKKMQEVLEKTLVKPLTLLCKEQKNDMGNFLIEISTLIIGTKLDTLLTLPIADAEAFRRDKRSKKRSFSPEFQLKSEEIVVNVRGELFVFHRENNPHGPLRLRIELFSRLLSSYQRQDIFLEVSRIFEMYNTHLDTLEG